MRLSRVAVSAVLAWASVVCAAEFSQLSAQDSFFQHMTPFRYMRPGTAPLPASTHEQIQPAADGLNRRGIHAPVDPQLQHRQWRRADGVALSDSFEARRAPTLDDLNSYFFARSVDTNRLDTRFARVNAPPAAPVTQATTSQVAQQRVTYSRAPVQSRQVRQVLPPETLNIRLGKMYGVTGANHSVADRSVGAGTGRVRSRR